MKKLSIALAVIIVILGLALRIFLYPSLPILNGFAAKALCSCVFVANIPEDVAREGEAGFFPISLASTAVDYDRKMATANFFGLVEKNAYYREGQGCAIFNKMEAPKPPKGLSGVVSQDTLQLESNLLSTSQNQNLEAAIDWAFTEDDPTNPAKRTRGVAIMYKGKLVAERYAEGFGPDSRMLGWSMTKSVTSVLYGLLAKDSILDRNDEVNSSKWPIKEKVTYTDLLQMSSGMEWDENYGTMSAVTKMLYAADTFGAVVGTYPITAEPGSTWYYSSGTTNLLTYLLADFFPSKQEYLEFPEKGLFDRIGMNSMVVETDASGHFVGSSYGWATPRDWARFGQMMLDEGVVNGDTIVTKEWVDFCKTPASASDGLYGGQFWLNASGQMPDAPRDAYSARGFHGQRVEIIPSKDLVIVRLGVTHVRGAFDFNEWTAKVVAALE